MTSRDPRMHLADALAAADEIKFFTLGFDEAMYLGESKTQSAVERQFLIIGEALRRLERDDAALAGRLLVLRQVIAFRNVLAHAYDIVDDRAVWSAVVV